MKKVKDLKKIRWNKNYLAIDNKWDNVYLYQFIHVTNTGYRASLLPPNFEIIKHNKRSFIYKTNYSGEIVELSQLEFVDVYELNLNENYQNIFMGLELLK